MGDFGTLGGSRHSRACANYRERWILPGKSAATKHPQRSPIVEPSPASTSGDKAEGTSDEYLLHKFTNIKSKLKPTPYLNLRTYTPKWARYPNGHIIHSTLFETIVEPSPERTSDDKARDQWWPPLRSRHQFQAGTCTLLENFIPKRAPIQGWISQRFETSLISS